jgi:hypothetical protein
MTATRTKDLVDANTLAAGYPMTATRTKDLVDANTLAALRAVHTS